jgi:excisionase family DNA binding protein
MGNHDLTLKEVAEELGIHIDTARRLLRTGQIEGYHPDLKSWRVTREALVAFKAQGGARPQGRPKEKDIHDA